jgi:hypothetical protein
MQDGSLMSVEKQKFVTSLIRSSDDKLSERVLGLLSQHLECEEAQLHLDDSNFLPEIHFLHSEKFVDPKFFEDAMS